MKAGSLQDDELGALRESVSSPSAGEVCLEVCSQACSSLPSSVFLAQMDRRFEITCVSGLKSAIRSACVRRVAKAPDCKSGGPERSFVGASPTACTRVIQGRYSGALFRGVIQGRRLTGKPSVSRIEFLSSNLSVPANSSLRKGSLTGKAVVLKTTAHCACGFNSCPFRQVMDL